MQEVGAERCRRHVLSILNAALNSRKPCLQHIKEKVSRVLFVVLHCPTQCVMTQLVAGVNGAGEMHGNVFQRQIKCFFFFFFLKCTV